MRNNSGGVEINELDGLLDVILILLMALMILLTLHYGKGREKDTIAVNKDNTTEEELLEAHVYVGRDIEKVHLPDGTEKEMTPEEVIKVRDSLLLVNPTIKTRVFLHNPPHAPGKVVVYEF